MDSFISMYNINCPKGADSAVLEDSIMHIGRPATAGSYMLDSFIALFDATAVSKLEAEDVVILGKMQMDEFGAGGLFRMCCPEPGAEEHPNTCSGNQRHKSGVVEAVADGTATAGLCNDYTGAIAMECASRGIYYIHPTYGTVSRYGLIPAVSSMDQIGVACRTLADGFRFLQMISGHDEKDGAMLPEKGEAEKACESSAKKNELRIGIPSNLSKTGCDFAAAMTDLCKNHSKVEFELKYFEVYNQVMQILCCAELSNNISRYDGIKFGYRTKEYKDLHELYKKSRGEAFGEDVKLAALIGAMVLSQENYTRLYDKAMRVRRLIKDSLEFDKYDAVAVPCPCLARLCGLPAVSMQFNGCAVTLVADAGCEDVLKAVTNEF